MKWLEYIVSYVFLQLVFLPFRFLSYPACLALGRGTVRFLKPFFFKHRNIARENIRHAFPEKTEAEREQILEDHFIYLGELFADSLYAPRIDAKWLKQFVVYEEGSEQIEQEILKSGDGVVLISGHFGTWEVLVHLLGMKYQGLGIYKPMRNPLADRWYKKMRESSGIELVAMEESSGLVAKQLKKGRWVGFGADQNAGKVGIFVPFLNRPASTFQGPALMAFLTGARLVLTSYLRGKDGKVHIYTKDLGKVDKSLFVDKAKGIRHYTELWTQKLESEIKNHPAQYFWVHRRWKTKPGDFPGQE